ncbi:hypothetical protein L9F63_023920, partial [Diploptera punctata]
IRLYSDVKHGLHPSPYPHLKSFQSLFPHSVVMSKSLHTYNATLHTKRFPSLFRNSFAKVHIATDGTTQDMLV